MKRIVKRFLMIFIALLSVAARSEDTDFCSAPWNSSDTEEFFLLVVTDPIDFVPVTYEELESFWGIEENIEQVVDLSEGETIVVENNTISVMSGGTVVKQFSMDEYLGILNSIEEEFNQYGYSIRNGDPEFNWVEIDEEFEFWRDSQDLDLLYQQVLDALKVKAQEKIDECLLTMVDPGICPLINMDKVMEIEGVYTGRTLELADGSFITIESLVNSINNTAKLSCAKGSLFFNPSNLFTYNYDADADNNIGFEVNANGEVIESNDRIWVEWSANITFEEFVSELIYLVELAEQEDSGENSLLSPFLIHAKNGLKLLASYSEELAKYTANLATASMEKLVKLIITYPETAAAVVDAIDYIKNMETVPSVEEPVPPKLTLKKRKDWSGLNFGNKKIVGTSGMAWYELRGSETAQSAQAFAEVAGYLFNHKAQFIGASGDFYVGTDKVHALMNVKFFGYTWDLDDVAEGQNRQNLTLLKYSDSIKFLDLQVGYQAAWPVGPILIVVELGARAEVGLKYGYTLTILSVTGEVGPYVKATGYAEAEVSIVVVAVGAEAEITLVSAYAPLVGRVGAKFTSAGDPYLALDIDATARYSALNGRIAAYVKYYVPRFGIPPWKKKKASKTLFEWEGINAEHKIMSWGMTYGYDGVELSGDILDQTDIAYYEALDSGITLVERAEELINYQNSTIAAYNDSLSAIADDINNNLGLTAISQNISQAGVEIDNNIDTYLVDLQNMLDSI